MNISDVLTSNKWSTPKENNNPYGIILDECSNFISESQGNPLFKNLPPPSNYVAPGTFRVKVRHKKNNEIITELYSAALVPNVRERSIFVHGTKQEQTKNEQPFYVFPRNGYKYLYSCEVHESSEEYKEILDTLVETVGSERAYGIITDMLKYTYSNNNLSEAVQQGVEIMFYGIPYYYAVAIEAFPDYSELIRKIRGATP